MVVRDHTKNSLSRACLQREIGNARRSYYMEGLWPGACVAGYVPDTITRRRERRPQGDYSISVHHFDLSPNSNYLYTGSEQAVTRHSSPTRISAGGTPPAGLPVARMTSPISSMNCLPRTGTLAVTTRGSDRPPVVYLTDYDRNGPAVGQQFAPQNCRTIWTASPKPIFPISEAGTSIPAHDEEQLAVGAGKTLQLYSGSNAGVWTGRTVLQSDSDVLALCWLDDTTLTAGHRNGVIKYYDTRAQGSCHLFSHSGPVNNLRRADDPTRMVCAGINSQLHVYDMRGAEKETLRSVRGSGIVTTFPGYRNENTPDLGMDVNSRIGLVAAADEDNNLTIWNMYTAKVVKRFPAQRFRAMQLGNPRTYTTCVRFVEDEDGVSLWANVDGLVISYGL